MNKFRELWPLLVVALVTNLASGALGTFVTQAVMRDDIHWIELVQANHETRLEALEIAHFNESLVPSPNVKP